MGKPDKWSVDETHEAEDGRKGVHMFEGVFVRSRMMSLRRKEDQENLDPRIKLFSTLGDALTAKFPPRSQPNFYHKPCVYCSAAI
jgi:hypothetical protein